MLLPSKMFSFSLVLLVSSVGPLALLACSASINSASARSLRALSAESCSARRRASLRGEGEDREKHGKPPLSTKADPPALAPGAPASREKGEEGAENAPETGDAPPCDPRPTPPRTRSRTIKRALVGEVVLQCVFHFVLNEKHLR